jgi:hypothetical protein
VCMRSHDLQTQPVTSWRSLLLLYLQSRCLDTATVLALQSVPLSVLAPPSMLAATSWPARAAPLG